MDERQLISEKASLVEPVLREYVQIGPVKMQEMMLHPIEAGGKRVRPILALLAAQAVGGDPEKALSAAASVELLHTFTLVHDDIMDHDMERRGRPTVHANWGVEMGILVGDALYSTAFKALLDAREKAVEDRLVLDAMAELVRANSMLQEGQVLDLLYEADFDVSLEDYMDMVGKKTGVLIEASLAIGAILSGASEPQVRALREYGASIGLAFQIKDDILDLTADEKKLGKPVGSDIRKGKLTLMVVHAIENADEGERKWMQEKLLEKQNSEEDVERFIGLLEDKGSIEFARNKLSERLEAAKKSLDVLPKGEGRDGLMLLADYIVERVF